MMSPLFHPCSLGNIEKKRNALIRSRETPYWIKKHISAQLPDSHKKLSQLDLLCIDIETTGLNPETDAILSIGMVDIHNLTIALSTSEHFYIQQNFVNPEAAIINHIVPESLYNGISLDDALLRFLKRAQGKVLVAHGATVEKRFLTWSLLARLSIHSLPFIWLDTLTIEKTLMKNRSNTLCPDLRLSVLRKQKGLPDYVAHNALSDAIATGELLLVLLKEIYAQEDPDLAAIYNRSLQG